MPKPDRALKEFFADNETFADLFNAVLFEGLSQSELQSPTEINAPRGCAGI